MVVAATRLESIPLVLVASLCDLHGTFVRGESQGEPKDNINYKRE